MKTIVSVMVILFFTGVLFIRGTRMSRDVDNTAEFIYPAAVKAIIDQKCYGCHSITGESDDAKESLMWDSIPSFPDAKLVAKLDDIITVLEEGSMPPEDVVKQYPEIKLLPRERKVLKSWAEATADSLMK